ncbi:MAG: 3-isopropylmalate dehydratase small subunit [Planctomycetota bacterium]|nr:3-isopropylmalate dehydratase small subunit [Planctomycetota bacterium]
MQAFVTLSGRVAAMDRNNVDTDQIIPKQFLKRIERTGFGQFLFYDWRFRDDQSPNPDFELNDPKFSGATILVSRRNFGSGSSREHAPWALEDYGFRVIIAESFADIFFNNCFKNGMLPITLPEEKIEVLFERTAGQVYTLHVDLREQRLYDDEGLVDWQFEVDAFRKHCLLQGLDDIALTLEHEDAIAAYERSAGMDPAIER